jgi:hypothetical protein
MLSSYADMLALGVGLILPAIVAIVTKPNSTSNLKAAVHAVLSVATGIGAVYQAAPSNFAWAPAVVTSFLTWLSGTAFYHSLLKKFSWFPALQNMFVRKVEATLHIDPDAERHTVVIAQAVRAMDTAILPPIEEAVPSLPKIPGLPKITVTGHQPFPGDGTAAK